MRGVCGVVLVSTIVAGGAPAAANDAPDSTVRLGRLDSGLLVVPVGFGAGRTFSFVLDTGASRTIVSPRVAERLGLALTTGARMRTSAGDVAADHATVTDFVVAGLHMARWPVLVAPLGHLADSGRAIDGILGFDVLGQADFILDSDARTLRFPASFAAPGARVPFVRDASGRMRVEARLPWGDRTVPLIVDSGATAVVLFADAPSLGGARPAGAANLLARTAGRSVWASRFVVGRLEAGEGAWQDLPAVLLPGGASRADAGLLPLGALGPVHVDHAASVLVLLDRARR